MIHLKNVINKNLLRELQKHKWQVIILSFILTFGGSAWFGMNLMIKWREHNIYNFYETQSLDDGYIRFNEQNLVSQSEIEVLLNSYEKFSQIQSYFFRLQTIVTYEIEFHTNQQVEFFKGYVYGINKSYFNSPNLDIPQSIQGTDLSSNINQNDLSNIPLMVSEKFARDYDFNFPQDIKLHLQGASISAKLTGTFLNPEWISQIDPESTSFSMSKDFIIGNMYLSHLQNLLGINGCINEIPLRFTSNIDHLQAGEDLATFFTSQGIPCSFILRENALVYRMIEDDIKNDASMFSLLAVFIFIVAIFAMWITLNRMIKKQKREIGIALSLGQKRYKILKYYLSYGIIIGAFSIGFSIFGGYLLGKIMDVSNQSFYPLTNWETPFSMIKAYLIETWSIILISTFIASFLPALFASNTLPIKAIRSVPLSDSRKNGMFTSFIQKITNRSKFLSMNLKMSIRNIIRSKGRSFATIIGFGLGIGLVLGCSGIFSSMDHAFFLDDNEKGEWDYHVELYSPINADYFQSQINTMKFFNEIKNISYGVIYFTEIEIESQESNEIQKESLNLMAINTDFSINQTLTQGRRPITEEEIIISEDFAQENGLDINNDIKMNFPYFNQAQKYNIINRTMKIVGYHNQVSKNNILLHWDAIQTLMNLSNAANHYYFNLGEYIEQKSNIKAQLYNLTFVKSVEFNGESFDQREKIIGSLRDIMNIVEILCYIVAFGIILITSLIAQQEREREIGTMLTIGSEEKNIFILFMTENGLLSLIGMMFGFGLAWLVLSLVLLPQMEEMIQVLTFKPYLPFSMWFEITIIAFFLGVFAQIPLLNKLKKIDLAKATKVRDF